ncbi:MAG: hemerythrin domain-containing protein [Bacteroidota bacterium]
MKRNEHLRTLSRDHHFGLLFCWKIRQGLKNKIATVRIRQYVNYYWVSYLHQHFLDEETVLFNPLNDRLCNMGISQHKKIEAQIKYINEAEEGDTDAYKLLADLVDKHIRFEERELFPYLESVLSEEKMAIIGEQLKAMHIHVPVDNYSDEFWLTTK